MNPSHSMRHHCICFFAKPLIFFPSAQASGLRGPIEGEAAEGLVVVEVWVVAAGSRL